jgi:hypothetical protein
VAAPYAVVALGFLGALFTATLVYPCFAFAALMVSQVRERGGCSEGRFRRGLRQEGGWEAVVLPVSTGTGRSSCRH